MSFETNKEQLLSCTKDLMREWHTVKEDWDDKKADEFEKKFIHMIESQVKSASAAIDTISEMYGKARKECSND